MGPFARDLRALVAIACLLLGKLVAPTHAQPVEQATIEAAITLQILSFTEWPESDGSTVRKIGIYESDEHFEAFRKLAQNERYQGRFAIETVDSELEDSDLSQLDAIFFPRPQYTAIPRIVRKTENQALVLIGAFDGFLEQGGMVKLVKSQKKLGFEIQLENSNRRGIQYRAKLLRLAAKIIKE
ncbi:YfiR family protein [Pelagicoccus mobilis]|uniref:YfiR family protein n=1 Tax=Pelagicoccus mobilis TaxID=415221 RepID=A0A934RZJ6_9BACT|nr:YfiR family protein [Pelagicoccus mobilis]MBK1877771.1 YfiR family protein [Pelagicoccus mobilis]